MSDDTVHKNMVVRTSKDERKMPCGEVRTPGMLVTGDESKITCAGCQAAD